MSPISSIRRRKGSLHPDPEGDRQGPRTCTKYLPHTSETILTFQHFSKDPQ